MPEMDGLELIQKVQDHLLPVKMILLTSFSESEVVSGAGELKTCTVLSKPCDLGILVSAVNAALRWPASPKKPTAKE